MSSSDCNLMKIARICLSSISAFTCVSSSLGNARSAALRSGLSTCLIRAKCWLECYKSNVITAKYSNLQQNLNDKQWKKKEKRKQSSDHPRFAPRTLIFCSKTLPSELMSQELFGWVKWISQCNWKRLKFQHRFNCTLSLLNTDEGAYILIIYWSTAVHVQLTVVSSSCILSLMCSGGRSRLTHSGIWMYPPSKSATITSSWKAKNMFWCFD